MRKHFMLAGVVGLTATLFSCSKNMDTTKPTLATTTAVTRAAGSDELDAILKDLSPETYLLTFSGLPVNDYITKSVYGTLSDEKQFGGPDFPSPVPYLARLGYKTVPINKIWIKTCPTMIPFERIASRVAELLKKVDSRTFADLAVVELGKEQQILATKTFLTAASRLQPDAIDKVVGNADLSKFRITVNAESKLPGFSRGFYGTGDITAIAGAKTARITPYIGITWKDILRKKFPNLIGCFDPIIMRDIRANLVRIDKVYERINIEEVAGGAVAGF